MNRILKILLLLPLFFSNTNTKELKMENFKTDTFKTENSKEISITFIKHASLMIKFGNKVIQIDPISEYTDYTKFPKADIILITHEHHDHLDKHAIDILKKGNTQIILNRNSQEIIEEGITLENGEMLRIDDDFQIEAVPAYNTTPDRLKYHPEGRDNGYILNMDNVRIYISGDTEDIPEMKNLKNIDIAFISVNQPYTMTLEQAVHAARMIKAPILYPYHYSDTNIEKLVELLKNDKSIDVRIRNMQ